MFRWTIKVYYESGRAEWTTVRANTLPKAKKKARDTYPAASKVLIFPNPI